MIGGQAKSREGEVTFLREVGGVEFEWRVAVSVGLLGLSRVVYRRQIDQKKGEKWVLETGEPELLSILLRGYIMGRDSVPVSEILQSFPGNDAKGLQLLIMNLEMVFGKGIIIHQKDKSGKGDDLGSYSLNTEIKFPWTQDSYSDDIGERVDPERLFLDVADSSKRRLQ